MILKTALHSVGIIGLLTAIPLSASAQKPTTCPISKAPIINVRPQTKPIQYDKTKTSAQLSSLKSNTISPYGLGVDQTTGGLRHDQPTMSTQMKFNILTNPQTQTICLSYDTINVDIQLQPKIYIAKEFNTGRCAREVLEHEKKHVNVDRKVINKYTRLMGLAIQKAVNSVGAVGPFPVSRSEELQKMMSGHIESALASVQLSMTNEMNTRQQQVDSLEEYERVGQYCEKASQRAFKAQQKAEQREQRRR